MRWGIWAGIAALLGSSGCSLVLDFSERADAGGGNPRCEAGEPNDVANNAPLLAQGRSELSLCGDDIDFFTLEVVEGVDVTMTTTADSSINLELALFFGANTIQVSDAAGPAELIERTEALGNRLEPGEYKVRVQSVPAGQEGDYDLVLDIGTDAPPDAGVDGS